MSLTRGRASILLVSLLATAAACRREANVFPGAPVVLICVDTLRADHLPAYGYKGVRTPALDALAADSIVFENALCQVPLTLASHASIFTGLLPFDSGVRDNVGYRLAKDRMTLAAFLRGRGYATGGAVSAFVLHHSTGIASGFDFYEDRVEARGAGQAIGEVQRPGGETEKLLEGWIGGLAPDKPFFAFLHLYEPHAPYAAPEPYASRHAAVPYDGEIEAADAIVGSFLGFLRAKGLYERSLLVFLSDHGEGLGEHGEDEHGIFLYREAIRVPLFVKPPGPARPRREGRSAALVDLFPSITRSVGADPPGGLPGSTLWTAGDRAASRRIYSETLYPRLHFGWSDLASLADGRFHYVHAPRPELYDWSSDPAETKDLASGMPAEFRSMRVELAGMRRPFTEPGTSDPETVKKLASLGYISATSAALSGKTNLPDPKDRIGTLGRLKEANRLAAAGRFEEAVSLLRRLAGESPDMLDAREALARVLREAGRPAEAFEALREADRLSPGTAPILLGLADLALQKGDFREARVYAQAAAAMGASGSTQALAEIALAAGEIPEARRLAQECLGRDDRSRPCWLLLARIEKEAGDFKATWDALERERSLTGADRTPLENEDFLKGDLLARMGRESEAEAAFRAETAAFPGNPSGWTGLALLYASQGRPQDASRVLDAMVSKSARPSTYYAAARASEVLGDRQAALAWRRKAEVLFPGARERGAGSR